MRVLGEVAAGAALLGAVRARHAVHVACTPRRRVQHGVFQHGVFETETSNMQVRPKNQAYTRTLSECMARHAGACSGPNFNVHVRPKNLACTRILECTA